MSTRHLVAVTLAAVSVSSFAQEMPKRKPGLWDLTMQMQGMPSGMKSQQCVDEKTDAEMQRKAMAGDPRMKCTQKSMKRTAGGFEAEAECTSDEGKALVSAKVNGDFNSRYTVETKLRFDPPRHGMQAMQMSAIATHAGACPAGMAAGEVRTAHGRMGPPPGGPGGPPPGAPGAPPPGLDPNALKGMTPEQMRKMAEDMKKASGK